MQSLDDDDFDPLIGVPTADLRTAAENVKEAAGKTKTIVEQLGEYLREPEVLQRIQDMAMPESFDEVMGNEMFVTAINDAMEIVDRYRDGEFNPVLIDKDMLKLASILVFLGAQINYTDSLSADATSRAKQSVNLAYIEARTQADKNGWRASNDTLSALASTATEIMRAYESEARTVAMTFKGFYFSAKEFLKVMDAAANRSQFERKQSER